jgi:hypothetical protein
MQKAIISKVESFTPIPGADRIQVGHVLGEKVIISKDTSEGFVGVLFPEGLQLSEDYCHHNNLYRDAEKNQDKTKKGFFEDNRRVRAQPFLGVRSEAYFASLESLSFTGISLESLKLGDQFNEINGVPLCQKYLSEKTKNKKAQKKNKAGIKQKTPLFYEHKDTQQFKHYASQIPVGANITITSKVHGTSQRMSNTLVQRQPRGIKSYINRFFLSLTRGRCRPLKDTESWECVVGTRRVVLKKEDTNKEGFHGPEQWRFDWLEKFAPHLDKQLTIFGEIVGWANNKTIMAKHDSKVLKDKKFTEKYGESIVYKYGCVEGQNRFFVYRITYTTLDGVEVDLTQEQIEAWCEKKGFEYVPQVYEQFKYDGDVEKLASLVENLSERKDLLTEDYVDPTIPLEGVVVRVDYKDHPVKFYKQKSFAFKVMEGIAQIEEEDAEDAS